MRNMLATLLFSQGTPMILAGDEFGRTQRGNNNAYAQDNEISWIDWDGIDDEAARAARLHARRAIELRREKPILRRGRFLSGAYNEELDVKDVTWLTPTRRRDGRRPIGRIGSRAASACCSTAAPSRPASGGAAPT